MIKPELISPAGTLEKLKTAFAFGADAIYAGVPDFSLRARINDFTYAKMKNGVAYAHARGKKVYGTLNIYAHNRHLPKVIEAAKKYQDMGMDAVIISDPGILMVVKKAAPKLKIHLSTQANCTNWQAAKFWHEQGVERIVLAREVTLKEIEEIHRKVPKLELEHFVHGAMCMSYSGRCLLSKYFSGRSANLGDCSQPCRWPYKISVLDDEEKELVMEEDAHGTFLLNSKDLCLIEYLDKIWKAGVTSFKIEGRTKSSYYVGAVTKLYREAIDGMKSYLPREGKIPLTPFSKGGKLPLIPLASFAKAEKWQEEFEKITNRGYTTGFLFGQEQCEQNFSESHRECSWQFIGEVIGNKEGRAVIKIHNELCVNDEIEIVIPYGENIMMKVEKIYDGKNGKEVEEIHGGQKQTAIIEVKKKIPARSLLRRRLAR